MEEPSAETLVQTFGRPNARRVIEAYCARGAEALEELLAVLLTPPATLEGAQPVNLRAVYEQEAECLLRLATAHPEVLIASLREHPTLLDRFAVLTAVAEVPGPETTTWLLDALEHRQGADRWLALSALIRRREPRVVPRLRGLLRDRDGLVVGEAVDGLRRWGAADDLPALLDVARVAPPGTREAAMDAIECICTRCELPLPAEHPGRRLVVVEIGAGDVEFDEDVATRVDLGTSLARRGGETISAPCAGVISAIDERADGSYEVLLRKTQHG